ncbi:MAG: peptide-N-glycosidase F-related protein [Proteobacteria bacterium]|nr:peptide-N-glycosidase F-related protein [Pseudomonadota bacterium]
MGNSITRLNILILALAIPACSTGTQGNKSSGRSSSAVSQDNGSSQATTAAKAAKTPEEKKAELVEQGKYLVSDLQQTKDRLEELKNNMPTTEEDLLKATDFMDELSEAVAGVENDAAALKNVIEAHDELNGKPKPASLALADDATNAPADDAKVNAAILARRMTRTAASLMEYFQQKAGACAAALQKMPPAKSDGPLNILQMILGAIISLITLIFTIITSCLVSLFNGKSEVHKVTIFDTVLSYSGPDGDNYKDPTPIPLLLRHSAAAYATKIRPEEVANLGSDLQLKLNIKYGCATYDASMNIDLVLVPKNGTAYSRMSDFHVRFTNKNVTRFEIARGITPFMNRDQGLTQAPYTWSIGHLAKILRDLDLQSKYDFWIEASMPGALGEAEKQIASCKGAALNDGLWVSADLVSYSSYIPEGKSVLVPIDAHSHLTSDPNRKPSDVSFTSEGGVIGEYTRTFTLDQNLSDARFYLITSKHGSGPGQEEYIRRGHNIYLDGKLIKQYTPGGSCEPYRKYNTMSNQIYGPIPHFLWYLWSNWCPGAPVPTRVLAVADLAAGSHTIRLSVPGMTGNGAVDFSVYLKGDVK